VKMQAYTIL